jgi:preprotein translocase subunit SecG
MYTITLAIEIIIAVLLIIVVLMQASKGGGLAGSFGGSNIGAVFGVRRTSDFLSKTTTYLAGAFLVLAFVINFLFLPKTGEHQESVIQQSVPPARALPPAEEPAPTPTPQQ